MRNAPEKEKETASIAPGASSLWMLPLLLMQVILQLFSQHLSKLKQMRRARPMPKDWQNFYPELRAAEWPVHVLLAEGARQILSGEKLDLHAISFDPEPPGSFNPGMPRSALAMHQRMEDLARFHADPERYVRRQANRIRARDADDFPGDDDSGIPIPTNPATTIFRNAISDAPSGFPVAVAIRGPP